MRRTLEARSVAYCLLVVAGFTTLKFLIAPLGTAAPFILYFSAVLVSAFLWGRPAGLVTAALAALALNVFFLPRQGHLPPSGAAILQTGVFLLECTMITMIVDRMASTRERLGRLQRLTAALSAAQTSAEVAQVVVQEGAETLGASTGVVFQPRDATTLELLAAHGVPKKVLDAYRTVPIDSGMPSNGCLSKRGPRMG